MSWAKWPAARGGQGRTTSKGQMHREPPKPARGRWPKVRSQGCWLMCGRTPILKMSQVGEDTRQTPCLRTRLEHFLRVNSENLAGVVTQETAEAHYTPHPAGGGGSSSPGADDHASDAQQLQPVSRHHSPAQVAVHTLHRQVQAQTSEVLHGSHFHQPVDENVSVDRAAVLQPHQAPGGTSCGVQGPGSSLAPWALCLHRALFTEANTSEHQERDGPQLPGGRHAADAVCLGLDHWSWDRRKFSKGKRDLRPTRAALTLHHGVLTAWLHGSLELEGQRQQRPADTHWGLISSSPAPPKS